MKRIAAVLVIGAGLLAIGSGATATGFIVEAITVTSAMVGAFSKGRPS